MRGDQADERQRRWRDWRRPVPWVTVRLRIATTMSSQRRPRSRTAVRRPAWRWVSGRCSSAGSAGPARSLPLSRCSQPARDRAVAHSVQDRRVVSSAPVRSAGTGRVGAVGRGSCRGWSSAARLARLGRLRPGPGAGVARCRSLVGGAARSSSQGRMLTTLWRGRPCSTSASTGQVPGRVARGLHDDGGLFLLLAEDLLQAEGDPGQNGAGGAAPAPGLHLGGQGGVRWPSPSSPSPSPSSAASRQSRRSGRGHRGSARPSSSLSRRAGRRLDSSGPAGHHRGSRLHGSARPACSSPAATRASKPAARPAGPRLGPRHDFVIFYSL